MNGKIELILERRHWKRGLSIIIMVMTGAAAGLLLSAGLAASTVTTSAGAIAPRAEPAKASQSSSTSRPNELCWEVASSPDVGASYLQGVAAVSANDVWAVGDYYNGSTTYALIEHWNGTEWSVVASPAPTDAALGGVAAVSANDVWAVGYYYNGSTAYALIEHWNGTEWSVVASPAPTDAALGGVAAVSANDVWAVGYYGSDPVRGGPSWTLIEHWNGTEWAIIPSPNQGRANFLGGVAAVSANDVWAVGSYFYPPYSPFWTLIEHWNGTEWVIVPGPDLSYSNWLSGVAAVSANDVWAVGYYDGRALIEHWNGTEWVIVPGPDPSGYSNWLSGVAAVSANDVWAVGWYSNGYHGQTLVEHWDGTAWSFVNSPSPGTDHNSLQGVAAVSVNDVWAVGDRGDDPANSQALVEHASPCITETPTLTPTATRTATPTATPTACTGWNPVSGANVVTATNNYLQAVAAIAANDIWAGGYFTSGGITQTLIEHWNGSAWTRVDSPNVGTNDNVIRAMAAVTAGDVWAFGDYQANGVPHALALRWDGNAWIPYQLPDGGFPTSIRGASALAADNIWVVGQYGADLQSSRTLIEHWDGSTWSIVPGADLPGISGLHGIAGSAPNDIWAVGYGGAPGATSLTEHWDGSQWSNVPSPDPGVQAGLAGVAARAANDVWAVGTATTGFYNLIYTIHWDGTIWSIIDLGGCDDCLRTAVVAPAPNDVWVAAGGWVGPWGWVDWMEHWDGNAWEYVGMPNVQDADNHLNGLAAVGPNDIWAVGNQFDQIQIQHYTGPCGTVTPTNTPSITPTGSPIITATPCPITFTDVNPPDYFYEAVMYLACHGVVSGYSDGTFRPYNNATRGQLSKIVVLAEGWSIVTPTGTPTFQDVPPSNPFYGYIETAYSRAIISGYSCGTGCLEFRPFNNITRGQLTKVIVLAQNWELTPPQQPTFQDVPLDHPFYAYIETAYAHQIISGYSCGTGCLEFRPYNNATRGQIAKIVYNAITRHVASRV